ncbi:MAG: YndM family protein [Paenisporosarcina sp.]
MYMRALFIKFLMITAVLWIVLGLYYGVFFTDILITSVLLTGVSFIGDVFILPRIGNVFASITDFGLAMLGIWLVGSYLYEQPIELGTAAFISALIITIGELFFHRYMETEVFDEDSPNSENNTGYYKQTNLRTEFAKESDIKTDAKKAKKQEK